MTFIPLRLALEIVHMAEDIAQAHKPEPRPVFLSADLRTLHRRRKHGAPARQVGTYGPAGFDADQFKQDVIECYQQALARKLARRHSRA